MAWIAYLFQYLTGGIVFALGLFAILRTGSCQLRIPDDRKWFTFLLIGYVWMALLHLVWTLAALYL